MGQFKILLVFTITCFAITLGFQNCGSINSNSGDNTSSSTGNPDAEAFVAGQDYDASLVPANPNGSLTSDLLEDYATWTGGFKAIAMNEDGNGVTRHRPTEARDQEDLNKTALEICQLRFDNKPCAIVVEGNTFKYNSSELASYRADQFAGMPNTVDVNWVPGVLALWAEALNGNYIAKFSENNDLRALAINTNGNVSGGWSSANQNEANRRAIQNCEVISYGQYPCILYAVNMNIVWDPARTNELFNPNPVTFGTRTLVASEIPLITDAQQQIVADNIALRQSNSDHHFAVLFGRFGREFRVEPFAAPPTSAELDAVLDTCNQDYAAAHGPTSSGFQQRCFVYSVNEVVRLTADEFGSASHHWHPSNRP